MRTQGRVSPAVMVSCIAIPVIACHLYGMIFPSAKDWGFSQLAFFPEAISILLLALMSVVLFPSVSTRLYQAITSLIVWFQRRSKVYRISLTILSVPACALIFWLARERFFLLGDGTLLPRTLPHIVTPSNFVTYFHYEPLSGYFNWKAFWLFESLGLLRSNEYPIQVLNTLFGVGCFAAAVALSRGLSRTPVNRILMVAFVLSCGGTALWFGYVENYTSLYFGFMLYMWASARYIDQRFHSTIPAILFGFLITLHFGMVAMLPSFMYLLVLEGQRKRLVHAAISLAAACGTCFAVLSFLNYSIPLLVTNLKESLSHLLGVSGIRNEFQHYTFFSFYHLLDYLNAQLMIAPFALVMLIIALKYGGFSSAGRSPKLIFLLTLAICGIVFLAVFNFDFGMARDWDLQVAFNLGLIAAAVYAWLRISYDQEAVRVSLIALIVVGLAHTAGWIGITSSEERGIARFETLADSTMWGKKTLTAAYEESAIFFRDDQDFGKSIKYYNKFLEVEPGNPRIMMGIATIYESMGNVSGQQDYMERAVNSGLNDVKTLRQVAALYTKRGEYDRAIELCKRILVLDPKANDILNIVGEYYREAKHDDETALQYFLDALKIDSASALTYLNIGLCYQGLNRPNNARVFLEHSLRLEPQGKYSGLIQKILKSQD